MIMTNCPIGSSIKDFKILNKIGCGGFAVVYRAKCLQEGYDDLHVAIKKIKRKEIKRKKLQNRVESEINIHSNVDHPSIVKLYTWFEDENYVYLVLELCEGGSLEEYLKNHGHLSEKDACHFIKQVIEGVRYLHAQQVLHRDLSLRNILLTKNMHVKIADFGMAAKLKYPDEKCHTMLGTANFISPEVVKKEFYDFKADCWSVGCILYALLYGTPPFDGREKKYMEIMQDAVTEPLIFPEHSSKEARKLLGDMLNKDPTYRINIHGPLQYSFFQKYETVFVKRNQSCSQKSSDSGMSSLSCSRSTDKNPGNRKTHNSFQSDINKYCRSVSSHESSNKMSGYHSGTCQSNLRSNNVLRQSQRSKSPSSKKVNSSSSSVNELKNKLQALPSHQEHVLYQPMSSHNSEFTTAGRREPVNVLKEHLPCYSGIRSESQLHIQSQNDTESLLPFPFHRLQHIVSEDHLTYFSDHSKVQNGCRYGHSIELPCKSSQEYESKNNICSHIGQYCYHENICSHEMICCCRQVHASAPNSKSYLPCKVEKNIELFLEKHPKKVEKKSLKGVMEPLTTTRLVSQRCKRRIAIITVLNDGQLCLEFLNMKKKGNLVNCVCVISKDGQTILLYNPQKPLVPSSEPPPLPCDLCNVEYFNYENLPKRHWKKYWYAKTFVDKTKCKTPKVVIYGKDAKCVMMENIPDPNYEVIFYNGCQITEDHTIDQDPKISYKIIKMHKTTFTDQNGATSIITAKSELNDDFQFMWDVFCMMKKRCLDVEARLEMLGSDSFFPVVCGRRPKISNGDHSTFQSLHSSALSGMRLCDITTTDSSPLQNLFQSRSIQSSMTTGRSNTTPFKDITKILLQLKEKPTVHNGKVLVDYKDGIQMWSSKNGQDVYFYDTHLGEKLTNIKQNSEVWNRIQNDLPVILLLLSEK